MYWLGGQELTELALRSLAFIAIHYCNYLMAGHSACSVCVVARGGDRLGKPLLFGNGRKS